MVILVPKERKKTKIVILFEICNRTRENNKETYTVYILILLFVSSLNGWMDGWMGGWLYFVASK